MQKRSHSTPSGYARMDKGKAFERTVQQVYENAGFTVIHIGLPDLFCVRDREIIWIECKAGSSQLRKHQADTVKVLKKLGLRVIVQRDNKPIRPPKPQEIREYLPLTGSSYRLR